MLNYPNDWQEKTLREICLTTGLVRGPFGGSLKKEFFKTSGYKVYEQRNAIYKSFEIGNYYVDEEKYKKMLRFAVNKGDFIISCSGTIGKIYRIPNDAPSGIINQALLKITLEKSICNADYFYEYFEWNKFQKAITDDTQGGAIKNLVGMKKFRNIKIFLPPLEEQKKIADTLSKFDEYIDDLAALIEKKKNIRAAALEDLMSRKIRLPGFCGEWQEKTLEEIAVFRKDRKTSQIKFYISTENIKQNFFGFERHNGDAFITGTSFLIGDTLMSNIRPYLKKICYADFEGVCNSDVLVFRGNEFVTSKFLYYLLANENFICYVMNGGTKGTKMPRGDKNFIMKYPIFLPPLEEQKAIAEILTAMDEEIKNLTAEREKIISIREGAMEEFLTGKIRLK